MSSTSSDNNSDLEMDLEIENQPFNISLCNFLFCVSLIFVFVLFVAYALYNLLVNFVIMKDHIMNVT